MAEIVKTVKIETGSGERSVKSLKKEISDLRDALLNVEKGSQEWVDISKQLTSAQEELNNVLKAGKQAIDADSTSIAGMEARYKSLYQTYRLLTQEQRKSAQGLSMQKELAELSKNLNSVKKEAGNFKDNIGHYADDMMSAFGQLGLSVGSLQGPFKLASQGASGLKLAWDTLAKHPVLMALTAVVAILSKLSDAIKHNEELQMRMNKVVAAFKPIGDMFANLLDKIAGVAVSAAEGIGKMVTWVSNLFDKTRELSAAELELADRENELIKNRREFETLNSADEARVAQLREQAQTMEDMVEKERLLNEAKSIQEQINQRNLKLAEDELEVIKQKNAITPNSTADLDAQAAAEQKVNQVRADGANKVRNLDKAIQGAHKSATKAADETKKKMEEILKRLDENTKTEKEKLEKKYKEELALLKKYHKDTTALEKEYQENLWKLDMELRVKRINIIRKQNEELANSYVQPSNSAFQNLILNASEEVERFIGKMKELLGKELKEGGVFDGVDVGKLLDNGKLTHAAKEMSEIFGLGLEDGMNGDDINKIFANFFRTVQKGLAEARKSYTEWNESIELSTKELQAQKELFDNGYTDSLGNVQEYFENLVKTDKIERDLLGEKALAAQKAFEVVQGLNERELNDRGYTLDEQIQLEKNFYDALQELRDRDLEAKRNHAQAEIELNEELKDSIFELDAAHNGSINSIVDTYKVLLDAYKEDGKISEKEAKKKAKTLQWLEGIQGAVAVAQIVSDTASGWMSINKALAAEYVLNAETAAAAGPAAAAVKAGLDAKSLIAANIRKAALLVNGVAAAAAAVGKTVASIKGLGGGDSGEASSASAAPMLIDSTPYSYTRELQTNVEREEQLNTPIYVRVTDIESVQARVRVTENESTF